jgi:hypothetical protein
MAAEEASLAAEGASWADPLAVATILGSCSAAIGTGLAAKLAFISTFGVGFGFYFASRSGIPEPFP